MKHPLTDERRAELRAGLIALFQCEFDQELSDFRADAIIDHLLEHLGATVYNQAIADARAWMQERIDDLDAEFHEAEERP
ncbi:MAG: DUF2164 family protein [Planctomycetes bacterium]|nr:DUF2164 family protein [Planctomycetota bacterium]MCB9904225.1 DUF2164 family protein [Planctomycetota bacterium]